MRQKTAIEVAAITITILIFDRLVDNYLIFHIIAELFSVSILFALFAITWNARRFISNRYLLFIGVAALFIGVLDLLHTVTYKGMNVIVSPKFYANQFWIATRFFESLVLLSGLLFLARSFLVKVGYLLFIYSAVTAGIILSILYFEIFPVCFIEGVGQTPFKIFSEYVIIAILSTALLTLIRKGRYFEKDTYGLLIWSIVFTILSEFCFTLYIENYDYINKIGHIFKILSFYMIYKANIQNGFRKPIETFFHDLKNSEEKIKQYNLELEKQIATKNRFFSIIAHDLKNPFTILTGFTEFLYENYDSFTEEKRKSIIKTIYETSEDTYQLLENLLSWSRTQTNTMPYNPVSFDIAEVLDESLIIINKQAEMKNIIVKSDYATGWVIADMDMIKTVVRNLLTNAVKFTRKKGSVTIRTQKEESFVRVSIIDTGVGISEEKVKYLFHIDKNNSTKGTDNESGTGLGLILCAEFIAINKGNIYVESEVDKGSTFSFTLPVEEMS